MQSFAENKSNRPVSKILDSPVGGSKLALQLKDNRSCSMIQKNLSDGLVNRQPASAIIKQKANSTGLPDNLKSGIENLSGHSMDDVKVHYNSDKPAQLYAHAYAQGTEIHIASGQEKHLPHEAWHVVQQKQGRVKPTMQMKGKVNVNDAKDLEKEADVMGAKAFQFGDNKSIIINQVRQQDVAHNGAPIQRTAWEKTLKGWVVVRSSGDKLGRAFEKQTDKAITPPSVNFGEVGSIWSSNNMALYTNYEEYKSALVSGRGRSVGTSETVSDHRMMVTSLEAEEELLKEGQKVSFREDDTHNYLLWSVPTYTGKQLQQSNPGKGIEELSGEEQASRASKVGKGYMMKQTKEHLEALTALRMIQGDEGLKKGHILAQYGKTDLSTFDLARVDPLHNPRDHEGQSGFTSLLKNVDKYYEGSNNEKQKALADSDKRVQDLLQKHTTKKDFNNEFHSSKLSEVIAHEVRGTNAAYGQRDVSDEVTRADLKDVSDQSLVLIGGRNAVFESVWGPKSAQVIKKASKRNDSIQSHGLKYHWLPKSSVQGSIEFPDYLKLIQEELGPKLEGKKSGLIEKYQQVVSSLQAIIATINEIERDSDNSTQLDKLAQVRKEKIALIESKNKDVVEKMSQIREVLSEEAKNKQQSGSGNLPKRKIISSHGTLAREGILPRNPKVDKGTRHDPNEYDKSLHRKEWR